MSRPEAAQDVAQAREAYSLIGGEAIGRHIFLCAMSEKQACCSREAGEAAWKFHKRRLRELGLVGPRRDGTPRVQRTKADCLQICSGGPIAVDAAELSLEGVRAENTVGNRTILDILNAQQELLSAQVQLVTARRNAYVAGFTLLAAMGRAEARDLGLEEYGPLYDPTENYDRIRNDIWDWESDPDPVTQSTRTVDIPAQGADIPELQTVR